MIPIVNLLGVNRDLILQNNEGSILGSSTAVFVSSWANKQFQKAGESASSPGSFVGIIHYASTNVQGDLIAATIADSDWAKITTHGKTWHNYQRRVETTWNEGDTLYLAMGVGQDGLLTNSPDTTTEIIEVGKCLINAGSNEDALIELSGWRSSLKTKDAPVDTDAVNISIVGGVGGDASASTSGNGASISIIAGNAGISSGAQNGGVGGDITITAGQGGPSAVGDSGDSGDIDISTLDGGASVGGDASSSGSIIFTAGNGGTSTGYDAGDGGAFSITTGNGGGAGTSYTGGDGGDLTFILGSGGAAGSAVGADGGPGGVLSITTGDGGTSSNGDGGASGGVTFSIGDGGAGNTTGGVAGNIVFTGGVGGSAPTAGDGSSVTFISGAGGSNATDTAPRSAGDSGSVNFTSGTGGNDTTATGGTGGASGAVIVGSGNAGASTYGTGGNSGNVTLAVGQGGSSTDGVAGDGGTLAITGGAGGYHATSSNSYTPGAAGPINITAGKGGLGSTTAVGADGADVTIKGGAAGDDRGAGDGDGGDVVLDGGVGDTNGVISIGETNASAINSGSGSTVWTHDGNLSVTGSITSTPNSSNGEMYISGNSSATTLSQTPTYTRITSTYNSGILNDFTLTNGSGGSSGALRYDGTVTRTFKIVVGLSAGASSADTIYFRIAKNGTTEAKSEAHRYMSGSNDEGSTIVTCHISLAQNDYIEIFASRAGTSADITVDYMNLNISEV